jgi:predicted O-methyltransferase YrrM
MNSQQQLSLLHLLQKWLAANPNVSEGSVSAEQIQWFWEFLRGQGVNVKSVLEIGFNAGLSAAAFLEARKDISMVSVDLAAHEYVIPAKNWIDRVWPRRHLLIAGDSVQALSLMRSTFEAYNPDLIFIDGAHHGEIPLIDMLNAYEMARPDTWIILDDVSDNEPAVIKALQTCLKRQKFAILGQYKGKDRAWLLMKKIS